MAAAEEPAAPPSSWAGGCEAVGVAVGVEVAEVTPTPLGGGEKGVEGVGSGGGRDGEAGEGDGVSVREGVRDSEDSEGEGDGVSVREGVRDSEDSEGEGDGVGVGLGEGEGEAEGVREEREQLERGLLSPGEGQEAGQGQGMHVALLEAPVALEYVPSGQAVALREERGQKDPAGQSTGAPPEQ